jgi:hypothetical protein
MMKYDLKYLKFVMWAFDVFFLWFWFLRNSLLFGTIVADKVVDHVVFDGLGSIRGTQRLKRHKKRRRALNTRPTRHRNIVSSDDDHHEDESGMHAQATNDPRDTDDSGDDMGEGGDSCADESSA